MTKILYVGDMHLGGSSIPVGENGLSFRDEDSLKLIDGLLDIEMDYIVFLGDIFDTPSPRNEIRSAFNRRLTTFQNRGIKVVILVGNHDTTAREHAFGPLRELKTPVTIVDKAQVIVLGDVRVYCLPWSVKSSRRGWDQSIQSLIEAVPNKRFPKSTDEEDSVLIGHLPISGGRVGISNYRIDSSGISISQLDALQEKLGFDFGLFGHYHKSQVMGSGKYFYVGSIDRIDFGERDENKRVIYFDGEDYESIELECRPMIQISEAEINDLSEAPNLHEAIVKVKLTDVSRDFMDRINEDEIRIALKKMGARYVLPFDIKIHQISVAGEKDKGRYGGTLENAIREYIQERYEDLSDDDQDELIEEALELTREE